MNRRSITLSIIPNRGNPGRFNIWCHTTEWVKNDCKIAEQICQGELIEMPDFTTEEETLHFVLEAIDHAYQEVSAKLASVKRPSIAETNARPSDTTVPM